MHLPVHHMPVSYQSKRTRNAVVVCKRTTALYAEGGRNQLFKIYVTVASSAKKQTAACASHLPFCHARSSSSTGIGQPKGKSGRFDFFAKVKVKVKVNISFTQ